MKEKNNAGNGFINGRKEYTCPVTSLPILELEEFINVEIGENYIYNINKLKLQIILKQDCRKS